MPDTWRGVPELVSERAAKHPDEIAIIAGERRISYAELDALANQFAHHLIAIGVGPEAPVGILLDRSPEFVIAALAILRAGGCYVPLDPEYPSARLDLMLASVDVRVVITTNALAGRLPDGRATVLRWEEIADALATRPASAPEVSVGPDNLTYLIFTSGSTGVPKAVAVPHRAVRRLARNTVEVRVHETDVVLHGSSVSFDAATFEIWGTLVNGARLVILPAGRSSVVELGALLRAHGVTLAWLTVALFHVMVEERVDDLRGLRQLIAGGDVMSPVRAKQFLAAVPDCRLVNGYGPTEVTTFTTYHRVSPDLDESAAVPIGRPIDDTYVYILDDNLDPVPPGDPGRLFAGGAGLARGYLGDSALTAGKFIPDPFGAGQRLYDTGDLATFAPNGDIVFLGRADLQVKKRGFRVEPTEIEEALRQDPSVRDAAVVVRGESAEDAILVAFLVTRTNSADELDGVRERLARRLPGYLVPDRLVQIPELPLNPNGKLDRRALVAAPLPELGTDEQAHTELESEVSKIWCEVLSVPQVGRADDFFALGGQSMLASRMAARIRSSLGVDVPLRVIFDHPTVAEIAELIGQAR